MADDDDSDNFELFQKILALLSWKRKDEFCDKLSNKVTTLILVIFAAVVTFYQFLNPPIVCWCPAHFTDSHVSYTNSYCWVKNTYYIPYGKRLPGVEEPRDYIRYYQWTAFILLIQACLFTLPSILWHALNNRGVVDTDDILQMAAETGGIDKAPQIAKLIYQFVKTRTRAPTKQYNACRRAVYYLRHLCGEKVPGFLVFLFFFTKLMYIANAIGQFFLLDYFLFNQFSSYGFEMMEGVASDHDWQDAPFDAFPRVTMCDFNVRRLGNVQRYTVQCNLPLNRINEKVYMFLWFWMALVAFVSIIGLGQWLLYTCIPGDSVRFVKNHLDTDQNKDIFPMRNNENISEFTNNFLKTAEVQHAVDVLCEHQMASVITEWFLQTLQHKMSSELNPKFWKHFSGPVEDVVSQLSAAFDELLSEVDKYWASVQRLGVLQNYIASNITDMPCTSALPDVDPNKHIMLLLKSVVFYQANKNFIEALNQFYVLSFKAYDNNTKTNTELDESDVECLLCEGCEEEREQCRCEVILSTFYHLNQRLRELGLLECVSGEAVTSHIHARIKQHVEHTCQGNFEKQYLSILQEWLDSKVVGWLGLVYGNSEPTIVQAHRGRLIHYMYQLFAKLCIKQLFDIIIEYPESEPALLDLKACLEKINLRGMLVTSLRTALETRLLHPGVNTGDILTAYISAIRALRVLDPKGVLLDLVCQPVRTYLRHREDTVRCIVSSLTEEGNTELSDELVKAQPLVLDESYHSDEDTSDWENWQPDPVDADPLKSSGRRSSDIISMLVNIYGSKELFVTEYQTLLADRILTHFNYDTEKEIRYLELLKLRFGETQLHSCEVMLKDVADSKRLNTNMAEKKEKENKGQPQIEEEISVSGMILSAQFWPSFREERLELPQELQTALDSYTKAFEALKGNRTLNWKPHLGVMDIELELKDRIVNMKVSPSHAAIIWYFQQKNTWTVEELTSVMKMPTHALRRKMAFWQSHGLLKEESPDVFVLVEEQKGRHHDSNMLVEEDEAESAMASAEDVKEEEYQVFWQYIQAMLTNLDSLGLERIHSMLQMFAMQRPGSKITLQELKAFLDRKVKDQKLVFVSGVYRLAQT